MRNIVVFFVCSCCLYIGASAENGEFWKLLSPCSNCDKVYILRLGKIIIRNIDTAGMGEMGNRVVTL